MNNASPARSIFTLLDQSLRIFGFLANLVLVTGFAYLSFRLKAMFDESFAGIGTLPTLTAQGLVDYARDPHTPGHLLSVVKCWVYGIALLGSGWMTVLGGRWTYHGILAILHRLRFPA